MPKSSKNGKVSEKTISRLCVYRRLLTTLEQQETASVFSHELASMLGSTAAQVRQDLKVVGFSGSPNSGYDVKGLNESIRDFLDATEGAKAVLLGVGNLGRALLSFFSKRRGNLELVAGFDSDPKRCSRVIHGCRCYSMADLPEFVKKEGVSIAIICVPEGQAQEVTDGLAELGVNGFLNFAPVALRVPSGSYVENMDMGVALEKVAYFSRNQ